jgi:hypothetical protein
MHSRAVLFATICSLFFVTPAFAENQARLIYDRPTNQLEAGIEKEIKRSGDMEDVVAFINDLFWLPAPLKFKLGGKEGPLYDDKSNEILIPYTFIQEVRSRFRAANYSETGVSVEEATMDALTHTLFHELAHALISIYELPVLGKEEDAADGLASVLLIEFFEDGAEMAISAADLFDLESEDIETFEEEDFLDEHSLDVQRFYTTLCHVYGSDPAKYAYLRKEIGFSEDRADLCIDEYENISRSWLRLLKPYMQPNKADSEAPEKPRS